MCTQAILNLHPLFVLISHDVYCQLESSTPSPLFFESMEGFNVGEVLAVVSVLLKGNSNESPLLGVATVGRTLQGRERGSW